MRVFVLGTGKCGTTTWAKACGAITNYTSSHESRCHLIEKRTWYPDQHIECANRLAWFLGTLDRRYGDDPLYVHLTRNRGDVVHSMSVHWRDEGNLLRAVGRGLLQRGTEPIAGEEWPKLAELCVATIEDNIALFLRGKPNVVRASLPDLRPGFDEMWRRIGAEGDIELAHERLRVRYNAGGPR